ncbi:MAG TPA: carboxypeptidase-like regulatory domain-containing protein [Kofleriaceae bacterium]|nr:carboxypeptidase-like regulatory domain-containing protein [Kofleriaceae bacterium]
MLGWTMHHRGNVAKPAGIDSRSGERSVGSRARTTDGVRVETGTIDGRAVDEANAPLAGVKLCTRTPTPQCAVSGADGAFVIANLAVPDVRKLDVVARLAHYAVTRVHDAETSTAQRTETTVTMKSGAVALTGVVRDVGGGPIAGARVTSDGSFAITDHEGGYTVWTTDALNSVAATADGYVTGTHEEQPPARLDFALMPEATISGHVIDAVTGRPVPSVFVVLHTDATDTADGFAISDDDGRFHADKLAPAIYSFHVDDAHARAIQAASFPLALGEHAEGVVVRVMPAFEVSGRVVVAPTGEPCRGRTSISLTTGRDATSYDFRDDATAMHVTSLAPGVYRVAVSCEHRRANDHYDDIVVADHDVTDLVWSASTGAMVTGRVVDTHGAPMADVVVRADEVAPSDPANTSMDSVRTAADGSFELAGLRSTNYQLSAGRTHADARDADDVIVAVSSDHVTRHDFLIENTPGEVVGHVQLADGSPARGVDIKLASASNELQTNADDNGRFAFTDVQGDYHATAFAYDAQLPLEGADANGVVVHVTPSSTTRVVLTTTVAIGEIHGHVIDDHGQPVDDAFVELSHYDAANPTMSSAAANEVFVGPDGSFRADDLPAGSYRARAYRRSGGEVIVQPVELGSDIALTLATTGSVTGIARLDGAPLQRFTLSLDAPASPTRPQQLDVVAPDGRFTLAGVAPAHYRLTATADLGAAIVELDVDAGQTIDVDLDLDHPAHVRGRAVDAATGQPLADVRISPTGSFSADAFTDASGQFDILAAPRGPMTIWFLTADSPMRTSWDGRVLKAIVVDADMIDLGDVPIAEPE